jgi:hypothetical protein
MTMTTLLRETLSRISTPTELRLFAEYGAIFTTKATAPPTIIFAGEAEVRQFQSSLETRRAVVGRHEVELQSEAMNALLDAATDMSAVGGSIGARADDSGGRSYQDTVRLWTRNVTRGLDHWQDAARIPAERADYIRSLAPVEQVAVILEMEEMEQIYFGTYFDRSILYSVAAPGASQHLSLLAFDVAEFDSQAVESALAERGWYRTVPNDLPHFTYLGHKEGELFELGLTRVARDYGDRSYWFWVPDLDRLA